MWSTSANPTYYSIYGGGDHPVADTARRLRPRLHAARLPPPRRLDRQGASAEPDCDVRLHQLLAHYAIALCYAQQEDEVLEDVYMKRWQAVLPRRPHGDLRAPPPPAADPQRWPARTSPATTRSSGRPTGASLMANRLEPINLVDFTGGLNLRRNQFQLAANESPEMDNIAIDPLGGIYTRKGWERWNDDDIVDTDTVTWDPRRALPRPARPTAPTSSTSPPTTSCIAAGVDGVFDRSRASSARPLRTWPTSPPSVTTCTSPAGANNRWPAAPAPHAADPADRCRGRQLERRLPQPRSTVSPRSRTVSKPTPATCSPPTSKKTASTIPNRLRWSHPTVPDDWAQPDFIDIDIGGIQDHRR